MKQQSYRMQVGQLDILIQQGLPSTKEVADYASDGIKLVLADIDATLTDKHEGSVCSQAREFADIIGEKGLQLALVTNNKNRDYICSIAQELSVPEGLVFSPKRTYEHKPAPFLVRQAMRQTENTPAATFAVGDGATDMISFFSSGIRKASVRLNCPQEAKGYWMRPVVRKMEYALGKHALQLSRKYGLSQNA